MEKSKQSILSFLLGLTLVGVLGFGFYWLVSRLLYQLSTVTSDLGKAIVTAGATIVVAVVSLVFGKIWEQRVRLQEEVRQRKLPVYENQIQLLFSVLFASKEGIAPPTEQEVAKAFRALTEKIIIWGGPDVIKAWSAVRLYDWAVGDPILGLLQFETFVKAIRAELGNSNLALASGDLLKLFVNDFDPAKLGALAHRPSQADTGDTDSTSPEQSRPRT